MEKHWYCIRRLRIDPAQRPPSSTESYAFFNCDSLLSRPEYMSGSFLTEYLRQMQNEGYSIHIVCGEFPECVAEPVRYSTAVPPAAAAAAAASSSKTQIIDLSKSDSKSSVSEQDEDIQQAIRLSLAEYTNKYDRYQLPDECVAGTNASGGADTSTSEYNADLEAALKLSLDGFSDAKQETSGSEQLSQTQLRDKRLAYFNAMSSNDK